MNSNIDQLSNKKYFSLAMDAVIVGVSIWYFNWNLGDIFFAIFIQSLVKTLFIVFIVRRSKDQLGWFVIGFLKAYVPFLMLFMYSLQTADHGFSDFNFGISAFQARWAAFFYDFKLVLFGFLIVEFLEYRKHRDKEGEPSFNFKRYFFYVLTAGFMMLVLSALLWFTSHLIQRIPYSFLLVGVGFTMLVDYLNLKRGSVYSEK